MRSRHGIPNVAVAVPVFVQLFSQPKILIPAGGEFETQVATA